MRSAGGFHLSPHLVNIVTQTEIASQRMGWTPLSQHGISDPPPFGFRGGAALS